MDSPSKYCLFWPHTFKPQLSRPALLGWPARPSLPRTSLMFIIENLVFWETPQFRASLGGWSLGISLEGSLESVCAYVLRALPRAPRTNTTDRVTENNTKSFSRFWQRWFLLEAVRRTGPGLCPSFRWFARGLWCSLAYRDITLTSAVTFTWRCSCSVSQFPLCERKPVMLD